MICFFFAPFGIMETFLGLFFFLLDMFSFLVVVKGLPFAQDGIVRGFSFIFMPSLVFYCFGNVFYQN